MNPLDENPGPQEPSESSQANSPATVEPPPVDDMPGTVAGESLPRVLPTRTYPADLNITWSWPHFVIFLFYALFSLILVQGLLAVHYAPHGRMSKDQLEQYLLSKPQFVLGSMVIWYALIFFFLYVTLSLLRGHSFWGVLGWRRIGSGSAERKPRSAVFYLLSGSGLSLFVAILSARLKAPENTPIEELFKYRQTAILFIAMAVLIAPLVEETLFRGYLYPLFARSFGVAPGIGLTGVLFGLMHGAQLGWTWSLVIVLILVGIIFTLVRARTGSVFASYMMHLGYNSLISLVAVVSTHGFTKTPIGQ